MRDTDPTSELGGYSGQQSRCEPVSFSFCFLFVLLGGGGGGGSAE